MTSRDIVPNEESVSGYMVQKDVNYIKLFSVNEQYFMLSVNNLMMRIAKVSQINAEVRCLANSDLEVGDYTYQVEVITRNCAAKN